MSDSVGNPKVLSLFLGVLNDAVNSGITINRRSEPDQTCLRVTHRWAKVVTNFMSKCDVWDSRGHVFSIVEKCHNASVQALHAPPVMLQWMQATQCYNLTKCLQVIKKFSTVMETKIHHHIKILPSDPILSQFTFSQFTSLSYSFFPFMTKSHKWSFPLTLYMIHYFPFPSHLLFT